MNHLHAKYLLLKLEAFSMAAKKGDEGYKLTLTGPGHTFEREVNEDVATKIITFVMGGGELGAGDSKDGGDPFLGDKGSGASRSAATGALSPKQFVGLKKPENNYERVACLAYYLTHNRDTPHFKTSDITKLNTESAHHFSNAALFVQHATTTYRYLSAAGGGKKQITLLGEAVVEAMPDRAKVAEAIAEHKPARKRKTKRKKAK
ncbi:hypothetical protein P0R27_13940 [Bradyrhizobium yuanmingense]|nr:hypothetical protein [Bradyrhizobium yuanmingense]